MILRYSFSVIAGTIVTMFIVFTMQALIATAKHELDEGGSRHFVDFVRIERQEATQTKERRMERPARPEAPPPAAPPPRTDSVDPVSTAFQMDAVDVQPDLAIGGIGFESADGDYLPIVKIAPVYPWKAQADGIEGYCIVEYTVTTTGAVKDIRVVEADPRAIFDKASIEAAAKFKYRPRVVNGEPIEVQGVRNLFRYSLEG
jgi:periplasmic protein TonB